MNTFESSANFRLRFTILYYLDEGWEDDDDVTQESGPQATSPTSSYKKIKRINKKSLIALLAIQKLAFYAFYKGFFIQK